MIRKGDYALYKGIEYHLTCEMEPYRIKIYTHDEKKIDESFVQWNSPGKRKLYVKYVQLFELEDTYHGYSYAVVEDDRKLVILKESEDQYLVSTGWNDIDLIEKYCLEEVERGVFEGWISKTGVRLVEELQHVSY